MQVSVLDSIVFAALFTLLIASLIGVLWTWFWALRRLWLGIPLLADMPALPARHTPWGGSSILLTVFVYLLVTFTVIRCYGFATGRNMARAEPAGDKAGAQATPVKGAEPEKPDLGPPTLENAVTVHEPIPPKPAAAEKGLFDKEQQSQAELMLQSAIINGLILILVPAVVLPLSRARLADLGLDFREWRQQVFCGVRAGMLITPVIFAIQSFAVQIWKSQKHPLEQVVMERFTPGAAALAILSAMFLAPFVEEMLFRGLLQQWLTRRFSEGSELGDSWDRRPATENGDPITVLDIEDPSKIRDVRDEIDLTGKPDPAVRAIAASIVVTSALFAGMHYLQWPAPIAIFVLALWLGTVYQQSRSLITAIALHATFNGFSTLMLLLEALSRRIQADTPQAGFWFAPETWF